MKTLVLLVALFFIQFGYCQTGALGFIEVSYVSIEENFIDATSEAFTMPELQLNENGIGIGGSGKFFFNSFSVGGGGAIAFTNSDNDLVKMNVGLGYGSIGYNLVQTDELLVNASGRLGGFGNTLSVKADDATSLEFGELLLENESTFTSGSFMYGAEVNVVYFIEQVPYLTVGISAFFNAPLSLISWRDENNTIVGGVEQGEYTIFGIGLQIGGGGFSN